MDEKKSRKKNSQFNQDVPLTGLTAWIPALNPLQRMIDDSLLCDYVKFQKDVPPGKDKEPVSEFRTVTLDKKYLVDKIYWHPACYIIEAYGKVFIVEKPNVMYSRPIL